MADKRKTTISLRNSSPSGVSATQSYNHMVASMNNCATTRGYSGGILMFDEED